MSIDATAVPTPEVEEAARNLEESRRSLRADAIAARYEAGVAILQTLGDALRGFPHVGDSIFERLADLTARQRLLLFWVLKVRSVAIAARCMGISRQAAYELRRRVLAKRPEFGEVFRL